MPAGNALLLSHSWQPVAGAPGALIYPLIRKIDTISSNSFLIQTPDAIILIDPGGLVEQAAWLVSVIEEIRSERDRPLFIFLTHAHVDHFLGTQQAPAFAHPDAAVFAVQETGASALECGDRRLTQADLLGMDLSPVKVRLRLLADDRKDFCGIPVGLSFANGATVTITRDVMECGLAVERITFGPGPAVEVYHTPGHSPDSICIRIGRLLFIGDMLFAANPGIAGICGWDQEALIRSLDGLQAVLSAGGTDTICPGHGRVISAPDTLCMLSTIRNDALALSNIAELNRERAIETAAFAEDCIEQVNELFTIMAGRLSYVSYVMDELGESSVAGQVNTLIPSDTIDELLEAFHAFAHEHHRGQNVSIHLALKAGQVIARLERSFKKDELAHIIDPTLVQRAERLLSDYTTMLRGFCPPSERTECDLHPLLEALVTGLAVPSCSDDDLFSSADDDVAFAQALLARIGARPLLEDIAFTVTKGEGRMVARIDPDDFSDLVTYILEDLVGTGSDAVAMNIVQNDDAAIITINGNGSLIFPTVPGKIRGFFKRLCERAGGSLSCDDSGGMHRYMITVGLAE